MTFEFGGDIEVVSAKTMTSVQLINVPGLSNLAGIAADHSKQKVYIVGRDGASIYVYAWNPRVPELVLDDEIELEDLQYLEGTWGLALDEENGRLYVTLQSNTVRCYDTNDWSHLSDNDITVTPDAIGIAIDVPNQIIYTGSPYLQSLLSKYVISTETETTVDVRNITGGASNDHILGLAVDQDTGLIYTTVGHPTSSIVSERVLVFDPNLTLQWYSDDVGNPAGIAVAEVSYKAPVFSLVKDNNDPNNECVQPWNMIDENYLTFDICWDANGYADSNVLLVDYLPKECNYYSSDPNGDYNSTDRTVTWDLNDIGDDDLNCVTVTVKVTTDAEPGSTITNTCEIEGDNYIATDSKATCVECWAGNILYVDADVNDGGDGLSWQSAYNDLQDAIDIARTHDCYTDIWVATGTYKPIYDMGDDNTYKDATFELLENVRLFGHFGGIGTYETSTSQRDFADANNETILDGQIGDGDIASEAVLRIVTAENIEYAVLDGFTIIHAHTTHSYLGSGVYLDSSDISILNCKFKDNYGSGIDVANCSYPDIHNCLFMDNTKQGVQATSSCEPDISFCIFDGNDTTERGISMDSSSVVNVENCLFKDHTGNGIKSIGSTLTVTNSIFEGNNDNGIQALSNSNLTIDHSVIAHSTDNGLYTSSNCSLTLKNSVVRYSGKDGIKLKNNNWATTIKNNWIHNNGTDENAYYGGAGIFFENQSSVPLVRNNTIYDNYTYGIQMSENGGEPNIVNCIIYANNTNDLYRINGTFDTVNYCSLQNTRTNNITGDPDLINVATDLNDLHLSSDSNCVDAGDPNGDYGDETDIDGERRIRYGRVDMGGDEYYYSPADFDESGNVDSVDYSILAAAWQSESGGPDYNEVCDLEDNNSIDFNDLALFCEDWLWKKAWGDEGWMMCMGGGIGFGLENSLMLSTATESLEARPERLVAKSQKFYDITPETTISARQKALDTQKVDIEVSITEILEWLDKIWLDGDLKESMTEEQYLAFRKAVEDSLQ